MNEIGRNLHAFWVGLLGGEGRTRTRMRCLLRHGGTSFICGPDAPRLGSYMHLTQKQIFDEKK